jgi:hypothetical protein
VLGVNLLEDADFTQYPYDPQTLQYRMGFQPVDGGAYIVLLGHLRLELTVGIHAAAHFQQLFEYQITSNLCLYLIHCNSGAYNVLMGHLRLEVSATIGTGTLEAADYAKWFNLAAWFTAFVRLRQVRG